MGLKTIPVRVVELQDAGVAEVAIIENLQRQDLNDLEKARAFQDYLDKFGCPVEDLARKLGKDRSTVSNILRLLELPDFVKVAISQGKISASHGRALLPLEEESDQIAMSADPVGDALGPTDRRSGPPETQTSQSSRSLRPKPPRVRMVPRPRPRTTCSRSRRNCATNSARRSN